MKSKMFIWAVVIAAAIGISGCSSNSSSPVAPSANVPEQALDNGQMPGSNVDGFAPILEPPWKKSPIPIPPVDGGSESMVVKIGTCHNMAVLQTKFESYQEAVQAYNNGSLVQEVWEKYFASIGVPKTTCLPPLPDFTIINEDSAIALFLAGSNIYSKGPIQRIMAIYGMHKNDSNQASIRSALDELRAYGDRSSNPNDVGLAGAFWGSFQLNCIGWRGLPPSGLDIVLWDDIVRIPPFIYEVNVGTLWSIVASILFGW